MRRSVLSLPVLIGAILAAGCTPPEIQPVAGDVYVISSAASRYTTGKREDLVRQANAFAESKGKLAVPAPQGVELSGIDKGGWVEYRFRLVDKAGAGPEPAPLPSRQEALSPVPEKVAEKPLKTAEPPGKGSDLYTELLKLDDLRKRGILTEEEFQAQKKKLLDGQQK